METQIKQLLLQNYNLSYKNKVFISYISLYGPIHRRGYQVHCEIRDKRFSKIYPVRFIDDAVKKFLEIQKGIK